MLERFANVVTLLGCALSALGVGAFVINGGFVRAYSEANGNLYFVLAILCIPAGAALLFRYILVGRK